MVVFSDCLVRNVLAWTEVVARTSCNHYAAERHPFLVAIASIVGLETGG